mmetsp:Transcript_6040/g.16777  ORF Transcript_6040/g.16777 Transcript_6040/m.16777 type:complete len:264 (-) Transcript_6040:849-1640(-)
MVAPRAGPRRHLGEHQPSALLTAVESPHERPLLLPGRQIGPDGRRQGPVAQVQCQHLAARVQVRISREIQLRYDSIVCPIRSLYPKVRRRVQRLSAWYPNVLKARRLNNGNPQTGGGLCRVASHRPECHHPALGMDHRSRCGTIPTVEEAVGRAPLAAIQCGPQGPRKRATRLEPHRILGTRRKLPRAKSDVSPGLIDGRNGDGAPLDEPEARHDAARPCPECFNHDNPRRVALKDGDSTSLCFHHDQTCRFSLPWVDVPHRV